MRVGFQTDSSLGAFFTLALCAVVVTAAPGEIEQTQTSPAKLPDGTIVSIMFTTTTLLASVADVADLYASALELCNFLAKRRAVGGGMANFFGVKWPFK